AYPQDKHGVLLGAQEPDRRGLLREVSDPLPAQARELLAAAVAERVPVEHDLARAWAVEPGHQLQQRRLPRPRTARDDGHPAGREVVREPAEHLAPGERVPVSPCHGNQPDLDGSPLRWRLWPGFGYLRPSRPSRASRAGIADRPR